MAYEIDYRPAALNELNGLEVWLQQPVERHIEEIAKSPPNAPASFDCPADHHGMRYSSFSHGPIDGWVHHFAIFYDYDDVDQILMINVIAHHRFEQGQEPSPLH